MNRVAAQNARDRKKTYVLDLERRLAELEAKVCTHTHTGMLQYFAHLILCISHARFVWLVQNEKLQLENKSLREKTGALAAEKHQLEKQLLHQKPHTPPSILSRQFDSTLEDMENLSESGSAVPSSSLQQKQVLKALLAQVLMTVRWVYLYSNKETVLLRLFCGCSLIHWLICCKSTGPNVTSLTVDHMIQWLMSGASHMTLNKESCSLLWKPVWWGTKQSTWNPLANSMPSLGPRTP